MKNITEGKIVAQGMKFAIVASRFNDFISSKLIEGALDALIRAGVAGGGHPAVQMSRRVRNPDRREEARNNAASTTPSSASAP